MKRKILEELKDLAEKISDEKASHSTTELKNSARLLYEKLTILENLESQINSASTIEKTSLDSKSFREKNWFTEPEPVPQPQNKEALVEPLMEKIKDLVAQMPEESSKVDDLLEEILPKKKTRKNDLEEFASSYQQTPTFERKEPTKGGDIPKKTTTLVTDSGELSAKPQSLNDKNHKGLVIGLNDRIAFIKHLFDGKTEDYTRVLSQISTLKTYDEAENFVNTNVKPDYNDWEQKEEFSERFMGIIEKNFN